MGWMAMDRRHIRGFNAAAKEELWDRWQRGESLKAIGRAFGKPSSSIYFQVAPHGGIRPVPRRLGDRGNVGIVSGRSGRTAIWLTEVAPQSARGKRVLDHLAAANKDANPKLMRLALKLATGAGKTTVMAMLIAWQTVNAVRREGSKHCTRGFLVCAPGLTIKDRLRVLQPNDPDSYYASREIVPNDMLHAVNQAKIVITNFHAFMPRERIELSKGGRQLLQGRTGEELQTLETDGQMIQRSGRIEARIGLRM
jgi:hypothetical protein